VAVLCVSRVTLSGCFIFSLSFSCEIGKNAPSTFDPNLSKLHISAEKSFTHNSNGTHRLISLMCIEMNCSRLATDPNTPHTHTQTLSQQLREITSEKSSEFQLHSQLSQLISLLLSPDSPFDVDFVERHTDRCTKKARKSRPSIHKTKESEQGKFWANEKIT
jgi:hypothetical protein